MRVFFKEPTAEYVAELTEEEWGVVLEFIESYGEAAYIAVPIVTGDWLYIPAPKFFSDYTVRMAPEKGRQQ